MIPNIERWTHFLWAQLPTSNSAIAGSTNQESVSSYQCLILNLGMVGLQSPVDWTVSGWLQRLKECLKRCKFFFVFGPAFTAIFCSKTRGSYGNHYFKQIVSACGIFWFLSVSSAPIITINSTGSSGSSKGKAFFSFCLNPDPTTYPPPRSCHLWGTCFSFMGYILCLSIS